MESESVIHARGLTKRFKRKGREKGTVTAVDHVDLDIRKGEVFGLLGPNGAGKTTTLGMLVTVLRPTEGAARVGGHSIAEEADKVRQKVGIVFQEPSLDTLLTARENLELHGRLYGVPADKLKARTDEMLALVDLAKRADDLVKTFSGGMKRRLEIARGLMHWPEVLFLDEPTLGLDPATREHVWSYIRDLRTRQGTTIVLTTHYMEEADSLCDRVAIIDHGKIVALDAPRALKSSLGGDLVTLTGASAQAVEALRALPFIRKLEERDGPRSGREGEDAASGRVRELVLTVKDAPQNLARIVQVAGDVQGVEVRPARLEDVFLALTGRSIREEKGEDAMADYQRYSRATEG